jgi:DNA-binding transcriptional regulator YdaS (Cro superfamily)
MKLKEYLSKNNITKTKFSNMLGVSRVTLNLFLRCPEKTTQTTRLAIEYLTAGTVRREDWICE